MIRRLVTLLLVLGLGLGLGGLSACGFQPQLRDNSGQYDIGIPAIEGRDGQILRAALVQRLNRFEQPRAPAYLLDLDLKVEARTVVRLDQAACLRSRLDCTWVEVIAHSPVYVRSQTLIPAPRLLWTGHARGRADLRLQQVGWAAQPGVARAREQALLQLADDIAAQVAAALNRP